MTFNIFNCPYPLQKNEILWSWHNWLVSNLSRFLKWKVPGTSQQSIKLLRKFLKIIAFGYVYKLVKFVDLISCGSKNTYSKMHPASCFNTHHDVTDFVYHGMVNNTKTWTSWKCNITFPQNKKILNLHLRWHILRSYCFVAGATFKNVKSSTCQLE